ncbi:MAG: hypothetical protein V3W34_19735 [Phycisphaerae bacterium]
MRYIALCLVVLSTAYAGAVATILVRPSDHKPGYCPKCGYSLYGLPSAVCPECGRPFSTSEAENDAGEKCEESKSSLSERSDESSRRARTGKPALLIRVSVLVPLVVVFYTLDWMPLRVAQRDVIGWSFRVAGHNPVGFVYEGSPAIRVEGRVHYYTAECTYLDLLMIVMPFVWAFGASRRSNIQRIGIVALVILVGNFIRCCLAVYLGVAGVDRFYAHDLPDYIIWWPTVAVAVLLALRRDFGRPFASQREQALAGSTSSRTSDVCA